MTYRYLLRGPDQGPADGRGLDKESRIEKIFMQSLSFPIETYQWCFLRGKAHAVNYDVVDY